MPKCTNCSYTLNLHPTSRRYKCSKCKNIFPQREIDEKEFHEFNKKERQKMLTQMFRETLGNRYTTASDDGKGIREWARQQSKKAIEKKEKETEKYAEYYDKNKERILARRRYLYKSGQVFKNEIKPSKSHTVDEIKVINRIKQWRNKQKLLALKTFSEGLYTGYKGNIASNLPT